MPLKMWFEHVVSNYITCKPRRCLTTFSEYIIGGQGILQKNMYQMQICPSICWYNHLLFSCIFLYSCVLIPKNSCFCPPKCPSDKKGQENYVPRVPGVQPRDKIDFLAKTQKSLKYRLNILYINEICTYLVVFLFVITGSVNHW